jgi:hypothetical protein
MDDYVNGWDGERMVRCGVEENSACKTHVYSCLRDVVTEFR